MQRPPLPSPPYRGGCLCGAVRYVYDARPLAVNACHCTDCQKLTGATNLVMILGEARAFSHEAGEVSRYRKRADSGREVDIVRCAICGTRLWHEPLASPIYRFIATGTLDDPSWAVPTSHIWTSHALPAAYIPQSVFACEAQPPDRAALIAAFEQVYPRD
jgi:hypothetical protein